MRIPSAKREYERKTDVKFRKRMEPIKIVTENLISTSFDKISFHFTLHIGLSSWSHVVYIFFQGTSLTVSLLCCFDCDISALKDVSGVSLRDFKLWLESEGWK